MYVLELIPAGVCGLMPGLGAADLLQRIWHLGTSAHTEEALDLFESLLAQDNHRRWKPRQCMVDM